MTPGFNEDEYRALLVANTPRPIESETDLPRLEEQIWELLAVNERTPAQEAYLTLLSALVGRWESERVVVPAVHGVELVTALLVERHLSQKAGDGVRNRIDRVGGPLRQARTAGQAHRGIGRLLPHLTSCILRSTCARAGLTSCEVVALDPFVSMPI